jgi:hypothetical protein
MQTIGHDNPLAGRGRIDRTSSGRGALWTGRVLSGLAILFLGFDSLGKLLRVQPVIEGTIELGYRVSSYSPLDCSYSPALCSTRFRARRSLAPCC